MSTLKQILCILGLFLLNSLPLQASDDNWAPIAEKIIQHIEAAESSYQANDLKTAKQFIIKAYFGVFEDKKMEAAMRQELGSKYTYQVEKLFGNLRKAMTKGLSNDEVATIVESIRKAMRSDAKKLDQAGIPLEVFRVNQ
jgi:fumarate hydratase class II/high-affinity iron transporter